MPATFLINLDRSTDRLAKSTAVLDQAALPFTRVPAVDGATLDPTLGQAAVKPFGRVLNPGEVGCFMSHRHCAQMFLDSGSETGLVIEDDVALRDQGAAQLAKLWDVLDHLPEWDLMNLGRNAKRYKTPIAQADWTGQGTTLFRAHYFPVTTTAILWSRKGAAAFLKSSEAITMPVDLFLKGWACQTGQGFAFAPSPLTIRGEDSEIDKMELTNKPRGKDRHTRYYFLKMKRQVANHMNARAAQKAWL